MRKRDCANPAKQVHRITGSGVASVNANLVDMGEEDRMVYEHPNPEMRDPADPNPDQDNPDWDLIKGSVITLKFHKTGYKGPAFFS